MLSPRHYACGLYRVMHVASLSGRSPKSSTADTLGTLMDTHTLSCQKATAAAAATLSESTPRCMGMTAL